MARARRRTSSRDESSYPKRFEGDAAYFTRRIRYDDLAVVIRRFPTAESAESAGSVGRPFVLVHGVGVSSRYFHPVAARLARFGEVFLVDLPGFGSAPNPRRDVTITDHAEVLYRYLTAEKIDSPILVGHSMGTQVISRLAVDHPEMTDRLVLLAPTMDPAARSFWHAAGRLLRDVFVFESPAVAFLVTIDYFFRCGVPYFLKQTGHLLADRIEDRLPLLTAKTLVISGERDPISPRRWSSAAASLVRDGSFAQVAGPHVIMFSDPDTVTRLISGFARA